MDSLHVLAAVQPGGYISTLKVIPVLIILLVWARLMTWADKDAVGAHLPRISLNMSFLGGLVLAFALFFYLTPFIVAFLALVVILGIEA